MNEKQIVGEKAALLIGEGMTIGLGTGSTVYYTIKKLAARVKEGLNIQCIPTSKQTEALARSLDIPLVSLNNIEYIDIAIDGADEIDNRFNLIKGAGGALLREKMLAVVAKKFVVVADASKNVQSLGKCPLPIEVTSYGWEMTGKHISKLRGAPQLRLTSEQIPYITDNGNYILDCSFDKIDLPQQLERKLNSIPGVVENGLFTCLADEVITIQNGKLITHKNNRLHKVLR